MNKFNLSSISLKSLFPALNINLQQREKNAIAVAGAALLVFLILQLFIFPSIDRREALRKEIISKTEKLQKIQELKTAYQKMSLNASGMEDLLRKRPKTFSLFSFIDQLAGRSNIKNKILYMKPSTANIKNSPYRLSTVEMKMNGLSMDQLTAFLHGVEDTSNAVWVKRITISRNDKANGLLNTVLQVETLQR